MRIVRYALVCGALWLPGSADAQSTASAPPAASPAVIDNSERHTLRASGTGLAYQIDIARVESAFVAPPADGRLAVIYVLDGNGMFPLRAQIAGSMVMFGPPRAVLVVAIGYPADPAMTTAANVKNRLAWRTRDLTPPPADPQVSGSGGAARFLAFIEQDLKPFVASRYRVDPSDQTLVGHSFGGLFAAWTLLNAPDAFSRYVLSSPSLFWNDNAPIKQAETFAGRPAGLARVFVSVGELETKERSGGQDMVGVANAFAEALQRRKGAGVGVDVTLQVFPNEAHISVVPGALMRGLREVGAFR